MPPKAAVPKKASTPAPAKKTSPSKDEVASKGPGSKMVQGIKLTALEKKIYDLALEQDDKVSQDMSLGKQSKSKGSI